MENAYGIGITNRYALFLDEDADPLDILKQSEADQKLAKAKKIEEATKPAPKSVKKEAVNNKNDNSGMCLCLNGGHSFPFYAVKNGVLLSWMTKKTFLLSWEAGNLI